MLEQETHHLEVLKSENIEFIVAPYEADVYPALVVIKVILPMFAPLFNKSCKMDILINLAITDAFLILDEEEDEGRMICILISLVIEIEVEMDSNVLAAESVNNTETIAEQVEQIMELEILEEVMNGKIHMQESAKETCDVLSESY